MTQARNRNQASKTALEPTRSTPAFKGIATAFLAASLALGAFAASGCGKPDPEENFRLWMNNDAGWEEMGRFVADKNNDFKLRTRALEILVEEGGQPSQVLPVSEKAPDRLELLAALEAPMFKLLESGGPKKQGHAKTLLMAMIKEGKLPPAKVAELKAKIAKWAFGSLTPDMPTEKVLADLKDKVAPDEIEALGTDAIGGAEIMLSKGIAKPDIITFLRSLKTPEADRAMIRGIQRYEKTKVNGKEMAVKEEDLAAIQATDSIDGFLYFLDTYLRLGASTHPDDEKAAKLSIQVAIDWEEAEDPKDKTKKLNQDKIRKAWKDVAPFIEKLLVAKDCDDRWLAAGYMATYGGADGLKAALAKLPDDDFYGKGGDYGSNDSKLEMTRMCNRRVKPLGADAVRPVLEASLKSSPRLIERIIAARCLLALGDSASVAALKNFDKKDAMALKNVQPIIVSEAPLGLGEMIAIAAEGAEYAAGVDKEAAEGKIDGETAKLLKDYASYSFWRHVKDLKTFAEDAVRERKEKEAKKAGLPPPPPPPPAAPEKKKGK